MKKDVRNAFGPAGLTNHFAIFVRGFGRVPVARCGRKNLDGGNAKILGCGDGVHYTPGGRYMGSVNHKCSILNSGGIAMDATIRVRGITKDVFWSLTRQVLSQCPDAQIEQFDSDSVQDEGASVFIEKHMLPSHQAKSSE